jgi:hypothetical protein
MAGECRTNREQIAETKQIPRWSFGLWSSGPAHALRVTLLTVDKAQRLAALLPASWLEVGELSASRCLGQEADDKHLVD